MEKRYPAGNEDKRFLNVDGDVRQYENQSIVCQRWVIPKGFLQYWTPGILTALTLRQQNSQIKQAWPWHSYKENLQWWPL